MAVRAQDECQCLEFFFHAPKWYWDMDAPVNMNLWIEKWINLNHWIKITQKTRWFYDFSEKKKNNLPHKLALYTIITLTTMYGHTYYERNLTNS